ncbi:hypothetical protein IFR05_002484 [Cadophora sp. M221]|nr:hypothetical protein IFR05_002484 [Cadophora sp. M221]
MQLCTSTFHTYQSEISLAIYSSAMAREATNLQAVLEKVDKGFLVEGVETISYQFQFVDGVFHVENSNLAECYEQWGRALAIVDSAVLDLYGGAMKNYFEHYRIQLVIHEAKVSEENKSMSSALEFVDAMKSFAISRKEPLLVIGGGIVTDVAGFSCAIYRRNTSFIRIPTTLIGFIDASVSIKVAVNYDGVKNRLGAFHAPQLTLLDSSFLRTLPTAHIRNGLAEILKISLCADLEVFEYVEKHYDELILTNFGQMEGSSTAVQLVGKRIIERSIERMLELEVPNLHEIDLDRVIAFGHTWSPTFELATTPHLKHGHAISIDMAYSTTIARVLGLLSEEDHYRILQQFINAGLSIDHPVLDEAMLLKATDIILGTRDGKLRLPLPNPIGSCIIVETVDKSTLQKALKEHKAITRMKSQNNGSSMYVDDPLKAKAEPE